MKPLYDYLKLARKRSLLGMSQADVAEATEKEFGKKKISQATVCHVELGLNQSPNTIFKLATVLDVPMEDLLIGDSNGNGARRAQSSAKPGSATPVGGNGRSSSHSNGNGSSRKRKQPAGARK